MGDTLTLAGLIESPSTCTWSSTLLADKVCETGTNRREIDFHSSSCVNESI